MSRRDDQVCEVCGAPHVPDCVALDRLADAVERPAYHGPSLVDLFLERTALEIAELEAMWALPVKEV